MYDDHSHPLSRGLEIQQIVQYFTDLFTDSAFEPPHRPELQVPFTVDELIAGLIRLPMTKALAPDGLPAIVWKEFAPEFGPLIYRSIENTWNSPDVLPPEHWSAGWLHLLAKPGKACNKPSALRPICLQHPVNKVISGILIQQVLDIVFPKFRTLPLYAYMPGRNTADCLLLASKHCRQVREAYQTTGLNLDKNSLLGGLQVSIDMEKAFDTISRSIVVRALAILDLPPELLHMLHTWLAPNKYYIPFKELVGSLIANRGIQ